MITQPTDEQFNKLEQEVIVLRAICGLIDEMVNYEMFASEWRPSWSNVLFRTSTHARLFNILLVDFLSLPNSLKGGSLPFDLKRPSQAEVQSDRSYLFLLKTIVKDPQLSSSVTDLHSAVSDFANWLDGNTVIEKAWFSQLELEIDMKVNRGIALKMTGDIGKHNFTRLSRVAKLLQTAFSSNGHEKSINECYLALPAFQEWFHDHAFIYQSSQIAEFLNRLRWSIHDYLKSEFIRSQRPFIDEYMGMEFYDYDIPNQIKNSFAHEMYLELMNLVMHGPIIPRFTVSESMKSQLS